MTRLLFAAALAAALGFATPARAQASATPYVFVTVDSVEVQNGTNRLVVTGILQGDAAPSTKYVQSYAGADAGAAATLLEGCERKALLAMAKPGQYLFQVQWSTLYLYCRLTRVTP